MRSAEVVIVGGGVMGASVAYHLASRGCRDVLVVERGARPGEGSTSRATGGFRAQFATRVNVELSLLSRAKLLAFRDETGVDPCFRQCGYLFVARSQAELAALLSTQKIQHQCGLSEACTLSADEVARLNPAVEMEGVVGGVFCPADGLMRPLEILRGYTEAAARLGVRFEYGVELSSFEKDAEGRVRTVRTTRGDVRAGSVVNAAGAWAARVAHLAGVSIPVVPLRRQVAVTEPTDLLPEDMPMTIFAEDGFHLRVRDGRVLLLWPDVPRATVDPFDTSVEESWLHEVQAKAHACIPLLKSVAVERDKCWAGLYEMTPDRHAILGRAPSVENLFLVNGSSGHGVMHAPALGQLLAEIILDGEARTLDARALRPERFDEGEPNAAHEFL